MTHHGFRPRLVDARQVWDHHLMHHTPRPCSVIVGLGSHDLGVADASAGHYLRGLAPYIVFTGATGCRAARPCTTGSGWWGWSGPGSRVG